MKTIGLIGGMSWQSSKVYYELINERTQELLGGSHSSKSIMLSVDFDEIERLSFAGDWETMALQMKEAAQQLERGGADVIVLCTNTIHLVSEAIVDAVDIPFIHIADATAQAIQNKGLQKVVLLGTAFTMEKEFYKGHIKDNYQIDVIIPEEADRQMIHSIIYDELVKGIFTDEAKNKCIEVIEKLRAQGAEGVIMGCTELPILIPENEVPIPSFDTSKLHAYKAVDWVLSD
ncbi:MAG: aspartate/glutamate racemase family protein [Bacteroidota bacterium]